MNRIRCQLLRSQLMRSQVLIGISVAMTVLPVRAFEQPSDNDAMAAASATAAATTAVSTTAAAPATCREIVPAEEWAGAGCRGDCLNTPEISIARRPAIPAVPGVEARNERPEASVPADVVKATQLPPCFEPDYPSSAPSRYSRFLE